jgi:hypothetical protein
MSFLDVLTKILLHPNIRLLPDLTGFGFSPMRDGDSKGIPESFHFLQAGRPPRPLPGTALAHGHQSTIAWIADLVGHIILEADTKLGPEDMTGLVLLDEIDLHLHPTWQVALVGALRDIFPKLQFVVTTHSPLVLASARPDEVVALERDPSSGDVVRATWTSQPDADARLMTTADLYQRYFGIPDIFPTSEGRALRDYLSYAADPHRTDEEDQRLKEAKSELEKGGIDPAAPEVTRA